MPINVYLSGRLNRSYIIVHLIENSPILTAEGRNMEHIHLNTSAGNAVIKPA